MAFVKCTSCGHVVEVPGKGSGPLWLIGCLLALVAVPVVVGLIGLLAAIAIPSFVKARQTSQQNACVNNMRIIDAAKDQWAMSHNMSIDQPVDIPAVNQYIKGAVTPLCPAEGTYTYHPLGRDPECSVHGEWSNHQVHNP